MPCKHGLDEINCPICRIEFNTIPMNPINVNELDNNSLKPENPFFRKYIHQKNNIEKDIRPSKNVLEPNLIQSIPKLNLLNKIPNFENKVFLERFDKIDINKSDNFEISKRISLENPKLNLKEED